MARRIKGYENVVKYLAESYEDYQSKIVDESLEKPVEEKDILDYEKAKAIGSDWGGTGYKEGKWKNFKSLISRMGIEIEKLEEYRIERIGEEISKEIAEIERLHADEPQKYGGKVSGLVRRARKESELAPTLRKINVEATESERKGEGYVVPDELQREIREKLLS